MKDHLTQHQQIAAAHARKLCDEFPFPATYEDTITRAIAAALAEAEHQRQTPDDIPWEMIAVQVEKKLYGERNRNEREANIRLLIRALADAAMNYGHSPAALRSDPKADTTQPAPACGFCGKPESDELHQASTSLLNCSSLTADDYHHFVAASTQAAPPLSEYR
jgi:hypothetical protein